MRVIDFKSYQTTFVPNVGDYYLDIDDVLYIVKNRVFVFDGTFKIYIEPYA